MTGATVTSKKGVKEVKNLGWLIRHWAEIDHLEFIYSPNGKTMVDGVLIGHMKDGRTYRTDYASLIVFWTWVRRPVFIGLKLTIKSVNWKPKEFIVGDERFMALYKLAIGTNGYHEFMGHFDGKAGKE